MEDLIRRITIAVSKQRKIHKTLVHFPRPPYKPILTPPKFEKLDFAISTRLKPTISRRLVANGLHSCRPLRRLPLTPPNRRQRLEWCRARSTWMTEWHRVVFSDKSRFCLSSDSRRGTMTAQRYVDDVLRPVTLPYLQGVPNALYQQDNARPHTARISQHALQDVQMLPWPPYSPDLSPIEHVWDIIGRRLHALPQPRSEDELWQMISGISGHFASHSYGLVEFEFTPHFKSDELFKVNALVLDKLTNNLPTLTCPRSNLAHLKTMPLADPDYNISAPIDILIGAELAMTLFTGESVIGDEEQLTATSSKLGWLLSGRVSSKGSRRSVRNIIRSHHACLETQNIAEKFWKLESIPDVTSISKDENEAEIHFVETHGRDSTGRYVVQLPFRNDCHLGDSRSNAIKRFCSLERSLIPRPEVYDQYRSFIKEYLELGHMSLVPKEDIIKGRSTNTNIEFEDSKEFVNVLGLQWQPRTDGFTFKGIALPLNSIAKRGILSQVTKIFDLLGWISPFTTTIKLILQELWKTGMEWDDPIPEELRRKLTLINQDLSSFEHIQIPRCVVPDHLQCTSDAQLPPMLLSAFKYCKGITGTPDGGERAWGPQGDIGKGTKDGGRWDHRDIPYYQHRGTVGPRWWYRDMDSSPGVSTDLKIKSNSDCICGERDLGARHCPSTPWIVQEWCFNLGVGFSSTKSEPQFGSRCLAIEQDSS
ncbi:hypothetical protein LAZ67_16001881 [Cordylochernes scorpioides]|uniref:Transposase n=1 Tax=Cordylochernes scorpioides TaxID=51811 RepID=A0ABY6LBK0_9ARAC|nr:hypothetical protein LAZ67_16001881 [Cordylochernes scorpioides]